MITVPDNEILKNMIIPRDRVIDPLRIVAERHKRWRIIKAIAEGHKGIKLEVDVWDYKNDKEFLDAIALYCIGLELVMYVKTANYLCMLEAIEPLRGYDYWFNTNLRDI